MKNNLDIHECILIIDFKQNLELNRGPSESSKSYYNRPQRSYFTISLIYGGEIVYYDFISDVLVHDSLFVIDCMNILFQSDQWKQHNFDKIHFWMDNGPHHFRTIELMGYFTSLKSNFIQLTINFFAPYHGKCVCDSHFSLVSRIINSSTKYSNGEILTTDDIIRILNRGFSESNQNKKDRNSRKKNQDQLESIITTIIWKYFRIEDPSTKLVITIPNFTCFYYFEVKEDDLIAKLSKQSIKKKFYSIKYNRVPVERKKKTGFPSKNKEEEEEEEDQTLEYLVNQSKVRENLFETSDRNISIISSSNFLTDFNINTMIKSSVVGYIPPDTLSPILNDILVTRHKLLSTPITTPITTPIITPSITTPIITPITTLITPLIDLTIPLIGIYFIFIY